MTKSMMIVGVGGQGSLLASRLIGNVLLNSGYNVKLSEVHGMSQRGGSVVTYVRWGEEVYSPIVDKGEADYILSFEAVEAARALPFLKKGGKLITGTQEIMPMPVITGVMKYPQSVISAIAEKADVTAIDALSLAERAGSPKAANMVLIGVLSKIMGFPEEIWYNSIDEVVPRKLLELNKRAFALGASAVI